VVGVGEAVSLGVGESEGDTDADGEAVGALQYPDGCVPLIKYSSDADEVEESRAMRP